MKFKGTLRAPRIDLTGYRAALHEEFSAAIIEAAHEWLDATVIALIPVWSGASHATFLRLARAVGYHIAVQPRVISRVGYGQRHGDGEIEADPEKALYLFRYETTLPHLIYNEYFNANAIPDPTLFHRLRQPGPYHFQQKGLKVFQQFAAQVRLPHPFHSLKVKTHKVS